MQAVKIEKPLFEIVLDTMERLISKINVLKATEEFFRELGESLTKLILTEDQIKQVYARTDFIKKRFSEKKYQGDAQNVLDEIEKAFA